MPSYDYYYDRQNGSHHQHGGGTYNHSSGDLIATLIALLVSICITILICIFCPGECLVMIGALEILLGILFSLTTSADSVDAFLVFWIYAIIGSLWIGVGLQKIQDRNAARRAEWDNAPRAERVYELPKERFSIDDDARVHTTETTATTESDDVELI